MSISVKRLLYRIGLYGIAGIVAYSLYLRANVPPETDEQYCERKGMVKIHNRFYKYDVYEHNEMKPIVDMLTQNCSGDSYCEIDHMYQYVLSIPYKESSVDRNPSDVINQNGGDCDEKSFLLATLLLQNHYECLLITTKEHGFIAVHIPDETKVKKPASYVIANGKKYFFAETTVSKGFIGEYNHINPKDIEGIFDMVTKKEIDVGKINFSIGS
ncbi:MAG: hypothetical protein PHQ90_10190 [Sulfuricurvum sp.]|uniref:hypothetical protein n=1 Tax=Sulfuricurvum sp. TaxID=2025608 RepID=UPI0026173703|nr:hypothetical protein [Sulfuricurvum sp.]MDD2369661.1 hypothetical protein [Sulfuricurvum sp.]MDD2950471.1 hypothetical protein [Sulfuricurvum sp.]MDD5119290.1 hypothetical protein [Sulfuricurvum sp.]